VPRRLPDGREPDRADPRVALTDATRRVIQQLGSSSAGDDAFAAASALVAEAAALLEAREHARRYGLAEGSFARIQDDRYDYSPLVGALNPLAPPLHLHMDGSAVTGTVVFGDAYEGPPGCVHGGFVAATFDEVLGFAQTLTGTGGMTGRLEVSYRSPTPLHRPLTLRGWIDRVDGRKVLTLGTIHDGDRLCAESSGLFIQKPGMFDALMQTREQPAG
jgi:acyl-coenzyme A thioesterase PaaI-like protein